MDARELFAQNLKALMAAADMSQSDLATRLGVSKTAVSSWCLGLKAPRMDKVDAMAQIFGVTRSAFYAESSPASGTSHQSSSELVGIYHRLTDEAQAKLTTYAIDLWSNPSNRRN